MKRILALLLVLAMLACGCSKPPVATQPEQTSGTQPTQPPFVPEEDEKEAALQRYSLQGTD